MLFYKILPVSVRGNDNRKVKSLHCSSQFHITILISFVGKEIDHFSVYGFMFTKVFPSHVTSLVGNVYLGNDDEEKVLGDSIDCHGNPSSRVRVTADA